MLGFFSFYLNDKRTIRPTNPTVTIYVDVDDLQKTLDRATSLGGPVVMPAMEVEGQGGLKIAQFKDPDGNVIGIMKSPAM